MLIGPVLLIYTYDAMLTSQKESFIMRGKYLHNKIRGSLLVVVVSSPFSSTSSLKKILMYMYAAYVFIIHIYLFNKNHLSNKVVDGIAKD